MEKKPPWERRYYTMSSLKIDDEDKVKFEKKFGADLQKVVDRMYKETDIKMIKIICGRLRKLYGEYSTSNYLAAEAELVTWSDKILNYVEKPATVNPEP